MPRLDVTHFTRRPAPGAFSIERVFENVRDAIPDDVTVVEHRNAHLSQGILPRLKDAWGARSAKRQVNHVVGDVHYLTYFLPRKRTILTVHDTILVERAHGLKRALLWFFWYWLPVKCCDHITTISEESKRRLLAMVRLDPKRVTVIADPVGPDFVPIAAKPLGGPYRLLHIGAKPNKNLERVLRVLTDVDDVELSIVGPLSPAQVQMANALPVECRRLGSVDDPTLMAEYARADALLFVSLDEGFGLPILEAQAIGRPVITSARAPMDEVAGDAAILVDPEDDTAIKDAISRLRDDPRQQADLISRGFANAHRFSAASIAAKYVDLYRKVAAEADDVQTL